MTILFAIALLLASLYLAITAALYFRQASYLYSPSSTLTSTPADHGYAYDELTIHTADNVKLHGWFVPFKQASQVILFFHGNTGNISDGIETIRIAQELGYNIMLFDYRGYGRSQGHISEAGTYQDAAAAWQHLRQHYHYAEEDIVILGRSLGAAIATQLASQHKPKALIIESTFTSFPDIASQRYSLFPVRLIARFNYNTLENIRQIKSPLLIAHSHDDEVIPYVHGKQLFEAANNVPQNAKTFMDIKGSHADGYLETGQAYVDGLNTFLTNLPQD